MDTTEDHLFFLVRTTEDHLNYSGTIILLNKGEREIFFCEYPKNMGHCDGNKFNFEVAPTVSV